MTAEALGRLEAIVDASKVAPRIEALLPVGVRPRQLSVRTLITGVLLAASDGRPAHLVRVHDALVGLPGADRRRLGVVVNWKAGPHELTYRQVERTFSLVLGALKKDCRSGTPTEVLQEVVDALVEASVEDGFKGASTSFAVDWTDVESFSTRRTKPDGTYADPEASWGHRKGGGPGEKDELFFGYYLSLATMVRDDSRLVPELVRRMNLVSCDNDPVPPMVKVLSFMASSGIALGDVVADSGYAHRVPESFALPLRAAGASLVMDLHPHDRGMRGTHKGAICCNGNLYCPATPRALFDLCPLPGRHSAEEAAEHDRKTAELSRYKLGRISREDSDGFSRVACPAVLGKLRCPLRPLSMELSYKRPEILSVPSTPPSCCVKRTVTVPPSVNAKTAQRHDYPSKQWRRSYARRSTAERANSRLKDPATIDIARGWSRVMGLTSMSLLLACAVVVRNLAVVDAFKEHQADDERRRAAGLAPKTRRRRRKTLADLVKTE